MEVRSHAASFCCVAIRPQPYMHCQLHYQLTLRPWNIAHCSDCAPQRDELETKYQRVSPEEVEEGWKHVHEVSAAACMHGDNCSVGDACQVGRSRLMTQHQSAYKAPLMSAWSSRPGSDEPPGLPYRPFSPRFRVVRRRGAA